MNKLTIIREQGGIPASLPGEDHVSGYIAYVETLPVPKGNVQGYTAADRIHPISTIERAEELGITSDHSDWAIKVLHYQLSECFRVNPAISLYVGLFAKPSGAHTFAELKTLQNYTGGRIRQVGIYVGDKPADASMLIAVQGVADKLDAEGAPLSVLLAPKVAAPVTSLTNLAAPGRSRVSVVIAQDGEGVAASLYKAVPNNSAKASVSALGIFLGALSRAKVHQSISWVRQFPLGLSLPAFGDGTLLRALDKAAVETLDTYRYLYAATYPGIGGSYASDSHTMDDPTSDYNAIERVRVMDKAVRGIRAYITPELGGSLYVNPETGKMEPYTVSHLEGVADRALEDMERAGELSGYKVYVNPEQNVLSSSTVEFVIKQVPTGVMRKVNVKIGFATKLN